MYIFLIARGFSGRWVSARGRKHQPREPECRGVEGTEKGKDSRRGGPSCTNSFYSKSAAIARSQRQRQESEGVGKLNNSLVHNQDTSSPENLTSHPYHTARNHGQSPSVASPSTKSSNGNRSSVSELWSCLHHPARSCVGERLAFRGRLERPGVHGGIYLCVPYMSYMCWVFQPPILRPED